VLVARIGDREMRHHIGGETFGMRQLGTIESLEETGLDVVLQQPAETMTTS